jgi:hypothetical protein
MKQKFVLLLLAVLCVTGCRSLYYSAWEKLGKEKRDLLVSKVKQVRDGQEAATEQLKDALTRLQEAYGVQGTQLESFYKKLQGDYEDSKSKADNVRQRIKQMDQIAQDLFVEWDKEAHSIQTASLREGSLSQLQQTKTRYAALYDASTRAERSIDPVLTKLRDYVLALKGSLNAQAMGALQGEATRIQADIQSLIEDMNASILQAEKFLKENKTS